MVNPDAEYSTLREELLQLFDHNHKALFAGVVGAFLAAAGLGATALNAALIVFGLLIALALIAHKLYTSYTKIYRLGTYLRIVHEQNGTRDRPEAPTWHGLSRRWSAPKVRWWGADARADALLILWFGAMIAAYGIWASGEGERLPTVVAAAVGLPLLMKCAWPLLQMHLTRDALERSLHALLDSDRASRALP